MQIRHYIPLLAAPLLLTACADKGQADTAAQPASLYTCDSGARVRVHYPDRNSLQMEYQGRQYLLQSAMSASGARYAGEQLEWWSKGTGRGATALLLRHNADSTSGDILETCTAE